MAYFIWFILQFSPQHSLELKVKFIQLKCLLFHIYNPRVYNKVEVNANQHHPFALLFRWEGCLWECHSQPITLPRIQENTVRLNNNYEHMASLSSFKKP